MEKEERKKKVHTVKGKIEEVVYSDEYENMARVETDCVFPVLEVYNDKLIGEDVGKKVKITFEW